MASSAASPAKQFVLPDVLSPTSSEQLTTNGRSLFAKKPAIRTLVKRADESPYARGKGKGSPTLRLKAISGHKKACSQIPSPCSSRLSSFPSSPSPPSKLAAYHSLLEEIIASHPACAPDLEQLRVGYAELLREREMETLRTAKRQDPLSHGLQAELIRENRSLARQCERIERKVREAERENERLRRQAEGQKGFDWGISRSTVVSPSPSQTTPFSFVLSPAVSRTLQRKTTQPAFPSSPLLSHHL